MSQLEGRGRKFTMLRWKEALAPPRRRLRSFLGTRPVPRCRKTIAWILVNGTQRNRIVYRFKSYLQVLALILWRVACEWPFTVEDFCPGATPLDSNWLFVYHHCIYYVVSCSDIRNLHRTHLVIEQCILLILMELYFSKDWISFSKGKKNYKPRTSHPSKHSPTWIVNP